MNARKLLSAAKAVEAAYIEDVFSTYLYTGTGSPQTITNGIDLSGKGGLVWVKSRGSAVDNVLTDTQRGAGVFLSSNNTTAQQSANNPLSSFLSTGFTANPVSTAGGNGDIYVSWTFRKQPKFFDVVTYTGNGNVNQTISHNLGATPGVVIVKSTGSGAWGVWHRSLGTQNLELNSTGTTLGGYSGLITSVTSSSFQVGRNDTDATYSYNQSSTTYVAYLFAHDAGGFGASGSDNVITCGSFTTDGSGNATVTLGYEPQWVMVKASSTTGNWEMLDVMRGWVATASGNYILRANSSAAEVGPTALGGSPAATGFSPTNLSATSTYIYIAIRRGPMKTPTTGTSVYNAIARAGTGAAATVSGVGFAPDYLLHKPRPGGTDGFAWDKLRGPTQYIRPNLTNAEGTSSAGFDLISFNMDGISCGPNSATGLNVNTVTEIDYFFRRAPGFFDEVCYTGGGFVNETIAHNLTVVPEFVIIKRRDTTELWWVNAIFGSTTFLQGSLNTTDFLPATTYSFSGFAKPTATSLVFNSGNSSMHASGSTYVAYLFATCPGVSKVGSYTGTGNTLQIDCGFTGGARFVLIKRTDSAGDWYVWDSARGIVAGNDPYLLLNSTAAEVTTTDWVDTHSPGFELSSAVGNNANINTASYIFLAIA